MFFLLLSDLRRKIKIWLLKNLKRSAEKVAKWISYFEEKLAFCEI